MNRKLYLFLAAAVSLLFLSCNNPLLSWNADIKTFVDEGMSVLMLRDCTLGGSEANYLSSSGVSVVQINMINPESLDATYTLTPADNTLYDTAPVLTKSVTDPHILYLTLDPALTAEHQSLDFTLGIYVPAYSRTYPDEALSFSCESAPNPVQYLCGGTTFDDRGMIAFKLPAENTDDDIKSIEITWNGSTETYDAGLDLLDPPAGSDNLLGSDAPLNRYFYPASANVGSVYTFSVRLVDQTRRKSTAVSVSSDEVDYTLYFDDNGADSGAAPASATYVYGDTATVPGNTGPMVLSGYFFSGWNTMPDGSGTSYASGDNIVMTLGNIVLYAQWVDANFNLDFKGDGALLDPVTPIPGGSVDLGMIARNQVSFTPDFAAGLMATYHWSDAPATEIALTSGTETTAKTLPADSSVLTLTATVTTPESDVYTYDFTVNKGYTLHYDGNGNSSGSVSADAIYAYNSNITLTDGSEIGKSGSVLYGWNTAADNSGTGYSLGGSLTITADTDLYAIWAHWLAYDVKGAAGSAPSVLVPEGDLIIPDDGSAMTNGTLTFAGWDTGSGATYEIYDPGDGDTVTMGTSDTTLYAVWVNGTPIRSKTEFETLLRDNSANWAAGKSVTLTADIDMTGYIMNTTIGKITSFYYGNFYGNSHTLSNLSYSGGASSMGLFGVIGNTATIQKLTLYNININLTGNITSGGGLCDINYGGTISDCVIDTGSIVATGLRSKIGGLVYAIPEGSLTGCRVSNLSVSAIQSTGGLVGTVDINTNKNVIIDNCRAESVTVNGSDYAGVIIGTGGLIGSIDATNGSSSVAITDCYATGTVTGTTGVGGLIGKVDIGPGVSYGLTLTDSYSECAVTGTSDNAGGLIGNITVTSGFAAITNCYATGAVNNANGSSNTGGLIGSIDASTGTPLVSVDGCYASGGVTLPDGGSGNANVGGLIGYANGNISNSIDITHCYASGPVDAGIASGIYVGGLLGYGSSYIALTECYAAGDVWGDSLVGGLAGYIQASSSVTECYAAGDVFGAAVESLIGEGASPNVLIDRCYARGLINGAYAGGLSGGNSDFVTDCYYLYGSDELGTGEVGRTAASLQDINTFSSWSGFATIWGRSGSINGGYPYLKWFYTQYGFIAVP